MTSHHVTHPSATHLHLRDETLQQCRRPFLLWPQLFSDAHLHETSLSDYQPPNPGPNITTAYIWQTHHFCRTPDLYHTIPSAPKITVRMHNGLMASGKQICLQAGICKVFRKVDSNGM